MKPKTFHRSFKSSHRTAWRSLGDPFVSLCLLFGIVGSLSSQDSDGNNWTDDTFWTTQPGTTTETPVPTYQIQIDVSIDPLYVPAAGGPQAVLAFFEAGFTGAGVSVVDAGVWQTAPKNGALYFPILFGEMVLVEEFDSTGNLISSYTREPVGALWTPLGEVIEVVFPDGGGPNGPTGPTGPNDPNDPNNPNNPPDAPQAPSPTFTCVRPVLIDEWEDPCNSARTMTLPEKEREAECPTEECEDNAESEAGSLLLRIPVGEGRSGGRRGWLTAFQTVPGPHLYAPSIFTARTGPGIEVFRDDAHVIRQVASRDRVIDVRVVSPQSFRLDCYRRDPLDAPGADGLYPIAGEPYRSYEISNPRPDEAVPTELLFVERFPGRSVTSHFKWSASEYRWSIKRGDEPGWSTSTEVRDPESGLLVRTRILEHLDGTTTRQRIDELADFPFGQRTVRTIERPDSNHPRTTTKHYNEDPADLARYGLLRETVKGDGSWERFEYDSEGRVALHIAPWLDSPVGSPASEARVLRTTRSLLPNGHPDARPGGILTTEAVEILGVSVQRNHTYKANGYGEERLVIEERAASPLAPFGADGNERTVAVSHPPIDGSELSGRISRRELPDGSVEIHTYSFGFYDGIEAVPGQFIEDDLVAPHTRVETVRRPAGRPDGVPGHTERSVRVEDHRGLVLLEQNFVRTADEANPWAAISWTAHAYDEGGKRILARDATGLVGEYRYSPCCNKLEWHRDRDGVETQHTYDKAGRIVHTERRAPGRPAVETHFSHDEHGRVVRETKVAGELQLTTLHTYDLEGERIANTAPDGLVTRFEHDHANRTHTTILPGGATQIEARYLDGQVKSRTGTAAVAAHYDYGVSPDTGSQWTRVDAAKADSPRWSRSTTDALGRAILQESPGHGDGVVLAAHTAFDEKGRVVATQTGWSRPSVGADDEKGGTFHPIGSVTLQTYDPETGELLLGGQDLDGDDQLVPGKDRLTKTERRFEEIAGAWWEVSRQWTYPLELKGQPSLVSEQRRRLTGLGAVHSRDPALGVLVAENVTIQPSAVENAAGKTENLVSRSFTYRHRESGLVTSLSADPKGLVTVQTSKGGVVTSVAERKGLDGEICCEHHLAYDALGRRISVRDPRTGESKSVYDPETGRLIAEIDPENRATRYAYYPAEHSAAGRLAYTVNADGKEQHVAYTARGEQRGVWGDSVQPLLYEYNVYGERVAVRTFQTTPDGDPAHVEDKGAKTTWIYEEATGGLLKKEYADGHGTAYAYNEFGQLSSRVWAREGAGSDLAGSGLASGQNPNPVASDSGKLNSKKAKSKIATSYSYDASTLQLAKSTATDGTEVTYAYDPDARLAKVTDATGSREFTYDIRGQVTKEAVTLQPDPETPPIHYEIDRTYTALGQPETVHLTSAGRDASTKRPPAGRALDHRIEYAWNQHNQLATVKSLAGEFVYGYDANNPMLLTKMTGPAHEVETSYEPHRNLVTGVVNRAKSSIGILPMARAGTPESPPADRSLTKVSAAPNPAPAAESEPGTKHEEPSTLSSYVYANDVLGRREAISQGGDAFAMLKLGENTVAVAYNDRSEVTGAVYLSGEEIRQKFDYDYDGIGNRRSFAAEVAGQKSKTSYKTNALNQYEKISEDQRDSAVPHDPDGNLLEDARNTYTWNADNNLVRVDAKDGSLRLDYVYDYQSRRTVRVETKQPGTKNEEQRTSYYLYDDWNVVADLSVVTGHGLGVTGEEADSVRYYTWGRDLSGSLQGAGGVGALLAITKVNPAADKPGGAQLQTLNLTLETRFPTYDANGNIGQLVDTNGKPVAAYAYDPFGNVTEMAGAEAAENEWRFSTKPVEEGTGWLYYGYRWYDAQNGRWVSRDPIEESGGVNLYGFVGNDGVGEFDRFGLFLEVFPIFGTIVQAIKAAAREYTGMKPSDYSSCGDDGGYGKLEEQCELCMGNLLRTYYVDLWLPNAGRVAIEIVASAVGLLAGGLPGVVISIATLADAALATGINVWVSGEMSDARDKAAEIYCESLACAKSSEFPPA